MALDHVHIAIIVLYFDSSRNKYNYLSGLSEDDALERMKEALNDGNDGNNSSSDNKGNVANSNNKGGDNHGC